MADMNRGLDLSVLETTTDAESDQFRSFYRDKPGTPHRGLNFWLDVDRPDVLKRYRAYADDGTPGGRGRAGRGRSAPFKDRPRLKIGPV